MYTFGQIFRCLPDERVEGGDFEKNDGTGGHSAFAERDFLAEQVANWLYQHVLIVTVATKYFVWRCRCLMQKVLSEWKARNVLKMAVARWKYFLFPFFTFLLANKFFCFLQVNSQFLIWLGDIEYKQYKYTLVFGRSLIFKGFISNYIMDTLSILVNFRVVEGLAKLQEVSRVRSMQVAF